jgi:hypothetical protein
MPIKAAPDHRAHDSHHRRSGRSMVRDAAATGSCLNGSARSRFLQAAALIAAFVSAMVLY